MADLLKLFCGFLLTTVFGGVLGYYFQNRAWRHQFRLRLLEADLASSTKVFEELSRLMDKRLYRMRQVHWKLKQSASDDILKEHMRAYREVLYEWNDALNRNLALAEICFGSNIKGALENSIYEEFSRIGGVLESGYKKFQEAKERYHWEQIANDLTRLGYRIYGLNIRMICSIQQRQQGLISPTTPANVSERSDGTIPSAGPQAE
jgi:hypothetical protein